LFFAVRRLPIGPADEVIPWANSTSVLPYNWVDIRSLAAHLVAEAA
jgi:hypothetical protein